MGTSMACRAFGEGSIAMPHQVLETTERPRELRELRVNGYAPAIAIPTDDPAAALQFCQRLAGLLDAAAEVAPGTASRPVNTDGLADHSSFEPLHPELSVVMPVYNEEDNLSSLYARLTAVLAQTGMRYEIVFVDDG